MSNPYLTGSFNKYRNKIKGNMKMNLSITPNIKITQYLERKKNNNHYKSPSNLLNKSQNIRENQKISKINLKNYIMNKKLNRRPMNHNQTKIKQHNRKSNSINPSRNNFSVKLNSMNNLPGCYVNNTNLMNYNTNNNNNINKSISKNNSLSYYYSSNNNTTNNKTKNLGKINNDYNLHKLMCIKANLSYYANFNYNKGIKVQKKNPSVNLTTDNSNSRNLKSSPYNYFITEESKVIMKEKNKIKNKSKLKLSYLNLKKNKKKNSNTSILTKNKSNIPLKIPHKSTYHPPQLSFVGDISLEKSNNSPPIDSVEQKIINEIKNIKDLDKIDKIDKLKKTFQECIDHFVPNEYRKLFMLIFKEFDDINKDNFNDIKNLNEQNIKLSEKLNVIENENILLKKKLEENVDELNLFKKKLLENIENSNNNHNYNKNYVDEDYENNEFDDEEEENSYYNNSRQSSKKMSQFKRNNYYFAQLNKKNIDDLNAIYFFDKVNNNINGKIVINNNNENSGNNYNYISNSGEVVPELNLDPEYIEECKKRELLKIEEENLTPFQRIALQFEMS